MANIDFLETQIKERTILLERNEFYVTETPRETYQITAGTVYVYLVRLEKEGSGRRVLLCEMSKGMIPSFVERDQDYKQYRFQIVAKTEAELIARPDTETTVLHKKFVKTANLKNYAEEGFKNAVLEKASYENLLDDVFLERSENQSSENDKKVVDELKPVFDSKDRINSSENPIFNAIAFARVKMGLEQPDYDRVKKVCKGIMDVPTIARASQLICREVVLEANWYCRDCGYVIGRIGDEVVACVPRGQSGYYIYYPAGPRNAARTERLTKEVAAGMSPKAYTLECTLPARVLKFRDLLQFGRKALSKADIFAICILGLVGALIGVLLPTLNQKIYDDYILLGDYGQLRQICIVIGAFMLGNLFFSVVKSLSEFRLQSRVGYSLQDALYHRFFQLPESFVRKYESADLAQRLMSVSGTVNIFVKAVVLSGISTVFSVIYLFRMFKYSQKLSWISFAMVLVYCLILFLLSIKQVRFERVEAEYEGEASSKLYQFLNGIEKIRVAGVEDRAIFDYMKPFASAQAQQIRQSRYSAMAAVLTASFSTLASMVMYYVVVKSKVNISMGSFVGFNTAFGAFSGALQQLVNDLLQIYQTKPIYERFKPVLETPCEDTGEGDVPTALEGKIEISHLTFSYTAGTLPVLDDINLKINKGDYLGIVGSSGCGKSTLIKLLLGFEKPLEGNIVYDGKDLATLDKQAFRRELGVVLQNGKLIAGSIYENITITNPKATIAEVQQVIRDVGLKDDIDRMPMGIHTVLSENSGTISGGQKQRILIARAIIGGPSILIFDEATSALDNLTQAVVSESLDKMNVTRLVVAHRLSTIRNCNRIIVLDKGRIVEEGNFETLMERRGLFYELASRQIAE